MSLVIGPPRRVSFQSSSAERIRSHYANDFGLDVTIGRPRDGQPLAFSEGQLLLGPLQLHRYQRNTAMAYRAEVSDFYSVSIGDAGYLRAEQQGTEVLATATTAAVSRPEAGQLSWRAGAHSGQSSLLISRSALEEHLQILLDAPVPGVIRLAPSLDLAAAPGWQGLFRLLANGLDDSTSAAYQPLVVRPLCFALLTGLLLACDSPHQEALLRPVPPCRSRGVKRAIDAMHAHPDHPYTSATLAEIAGVGVRSLQEGFRRHVGVPPMAYLRRVRLARAHDDLDNGRAPAG